MIDDAAARVVDGMTQEQFDEELEQRRKRQADRDQAMHDPQTLEQFRIFLQENN